MVVLVDVLKEGYSTFDEVSKTMFANCTSTLIRDDKVNVVVDTLTAWDRSVLIDELAKRNLTCDDITHLVCTHGHSDHVGNLNLFTKAIHIIGSAISSHEKNMYHPFQEGVPYEISSNIEVFGTPGHTGSDVSVLVRNTELGLIVVAGDLFEKEEDIRKPYLWREVAGSESPTLQFENRDRVLHMANAIIPGHGPMFMVTERLVQKHKEKWENFK